jgi:hypothetical protein
LVWVETHGFNLGCFLPCPNGNSLSRQPSRSFVQTKALAGLIDGIWKIEDLLTAPI